MKLALSTHHRWWLVNAVLVLGIIATALAAVQTSHRNRALFAELQELQSSQWTLQEQWGRLLLEESTWAHHHRVEEVASERLSMTVPGPDDVEVLDP